AQALTIDRKYIPAILLLADVNLRKGDAASAIASLNDLLKRDSSVYRAYTLLAAAYQVSGKPNEAVATYIRAAKAFPNNVEAAYLLADAFRQQRKLDDARKIFDGILTTRPDDPQTMSQLTT